MKKKITFNQLKQLVKEDIGIAKPKTPMKFQLAWYGYEEGPKRKRTFTAKNLYAAVKEMLELCETYVMPEELVPDEAAKARLAEEDPDVDVDSLKTPEEAIESIKDQNGDGSAYIFLFKNLTTGETYIEEDDLEEEW